jgi:hypothetical protein
VIALGPLVQAIVDGTATQRYLLRVLILLPFAIGTSWLLGRYIWRVAERDYCKAVKEVAAQGPSGSGELPPN